ncbi:hypothetical protein SEA_SHROOMS_13 [Arthrobacter phage Shrooms]|nr:hypothetical protein SEA_SHROOMS_13 [Arthrobacter phage Shrooms]
MTAVVNLDAQLPKVEVPKLDPVWLTPADNSDDVHAAMEIVAEDIKFLRDQCAKRGRRHSWKARPLRNLTARIEQIQKDSDPYGALLTYLDEVVFLESQIRQTLETVRELTGEDV